MKLKAFTITELMVVSILSAICAGAVFAGTQVIQEQYLVYEKETAEILNIGAFQVQLEKDIMESVWIERTMNFLKIETADYDITYEFGADGISREIRIAGVNKKKYPFAVKKIFTSYEKQEIASGSIDFLSLQLQQNTSLFTFSLKKEYSAQQKILNQRLKLNN